MAVVGRIGHQASSHSLHLSGSFMKRQSRSSRNCAQDFAHSILLGLVQSNHGIWSLAVIICWSRFHYGSLNFRHTLRGTATAPSGKPIACVCHRAPNLATSIFDIEVNDEGTSAIEADVRTCFFSSGQSSYLRRLAMDKEE